jgi:hypothetical protein
MFILQPGLQASDHHWHDSSRFRVLRGDSAVIRRILMLRDHKTIKSLLSLSALSCVFKVSWNGDGGWQGVLGGGVVFVKGVTGGKFRFSGDKELR